MESSPGQTRARGAAMVALAAVLWGGWALVLRPSGLSSVQSSLVVLLTLAAPAPLVTRRAALRDRGATLALLILGAADAGNVLLYFAALERGPVAVAVLTHYLAPLLVALAAPLVAGERLSRRAALSAPLSLAGLALLVWRPGGRIPLDTALLGAGSAVFYAAIVFSGKRAARAHGPLAVASLHALVSAAILLALYGASAIPASAAGALRVALGTLLLGLVASQLFYGGLARVPAQVASGLTWLEPVSAAAVGALAFGEQVGWLGAAGAALAVGAGVWTALDPMKSS